MFYIERWLVVPHQRCHHGVLAYTVQNNITDMNIILKIMHVCKTKEWLDTRFRCVWMSVLLSHLKTQRG